MESIQSILFDKNIYSYSKAVRWLLYEGHLKYATEGFLFGASRKYKHFTITSQFLRFKFKESDETKYNYKMEKMGIGIYYIYEYPKLSL